MLSIVCRIIGVWFVACACILFLFCFAQRNKFDFQDGKNAVQELSIFFEIWLPLNLIGFSAFFFANLG